MMNPTEWAEYRARVLEDLRDALEADLEADEPFLLLGDGHGIYDPEAYRLLGVPEETVELVTREHRSDFSSPKATIYDGDGKPVAERRGVYHAEWLSHVGRALGAQPPTAMGRGFRARQWVENIRAKLGGEEAPASEELKTMSETTRAELREAVDIMRAAGLPDLEEIQAAPTLESGWSADLIAKRYDAEGTSWKVWRNRGGPEDGETHLVEVEKLDMETGRWELLAKLYPYGLERGGPAPRYREQ